MIYGEIYKKEKCDRNDKRKNIKYYEHTKGQ